MMAAIETRQQCMVYLITYSRADFAKVPTRQRFADIVVNAFEQSVDVARVSHWVVSQEDHQQNSDDDGRSGKHYHMAVKLTKRARWARVRGYLESSHEIRVNFSANHNTYYSAYQYVTKDDKDFVLSNAHPELRDPPTTENAIAAMQEGSKERKKRKAKEERKDIEFTKDTPFFATADAPLVLVKGGFVDHANTQMMEEDHQQNSDDDGRSGKHYHMAVKLTKRARWARVRGYLESSHEIRVNFSANHNTYYSAYQYVTKDDKDFVLSNAHPELRDPPTTENAIAARKAQRRGKKGKRKRSERYSTFDVVEVIQHHNITTRLELVCLAMKQKDAGKTTLAEFIANRGSKVIDEALFLAKEFKEAPANRADFAKVPTRQRFADIVVNAFEQSVDVARVSHWVVSQEDHQQNSDDDGRSGKHYHMAVKLTKRARWARVRGYLESSHEIRVNFSANHNTYYSAYQYVTKDDKDFVLSNAHPELRDPPTTENAIAACRKAQRRGKKGKRKRSERYSTFDVVEVIQHHNITTRLELVCLAMKQKDAGKTTLAEFIANRGSKVIDEALFLAKEFKEAPANRADFAKVPTRQRFADIVVNAFEQSVDVARVSHWVVSQEDHQQNSDDDGRSGKHYHMAVKLTKRARWARVRGYLESSHEIRVNFSANHNTYYSAYQYVTKDDKDFVLSNAHPELRDPPTTENAIAACRKAQRRGKKGKRKRSERYSTFDVVEVIQHHNITTRLELVCLAMKQKDAGKTTLAEFIANRGSKVIDEALFLAKEFKEAPANRADFAKVPTRQRFADIVVNAFEQSVDVARVSHWVVSQEDHQQNSDDDGRSGKHYHMAVKLTKRARWARVRGYLESSHEIRVNFSANHNTYYSAYQYVTKDDKDFVLSNAHPELRDPPTTENAIAAMQEGSKERKKRKAKEERKVLHI
ncbi:hypothetical protein QZH41_007948 [Actinostola sp. cb2023]|nr:hypothetical protein QZH41_007948 [Actinostola sp. cb2023]